MPTGVAAATLATPHVTATAGLRVQANLVNYDLQVANPTITPVSGSYASPLQITMACATTQAVIHYTLDGTEPHEGSPIYTGAISLTA